MFITAPLTLCVVALLSRSTLASIGPVTDLVISDATVSPDGYSRSAVVVAGQTPGPLIVGNKGDQFQINVVNQLDNHTMLQSTSIHWHGFFQVGTTWADGPAFVNQCPIATGNSFLYDFSSTTQAGTFWYHSHLSTQYCDGLRGPIVVYDPNDPYASLYDVDDESTVITLTDWYHTAAKLGVKFPTPDSSLINGLGRYSPEGATSELAVINVEQGKRYRIRLLNMACDPNYVFQIDGHNMTIIEVDGVNHEQLPVDSITIYAAQRYSFILDANQPIGNYWIRANPSSGPAGFADGINSAILRYSGAPIAEPTSALVASTNPLNEVNLHPLENPGAPGNPVAGGTDVVKSFALGFNGDFTVNGATFSPPSVPVLLQILSGAQTADTLLPSGSVYPLPSNSTIELSLPGGIPGGGHPFHLHGHTFDVVRSASSTTYNYANPVRRDVVNIGGAGDNVTIRWRTDNPGPWFLHCHIDWHLEAGLAVVFAEDSPDWSTADPVPDAWNNLCPIYNALDPSET